MSDDMEEFADHLGELGRGQSWWACPCGIVLATYLDDARTRYRTHLQATHDRLTAEVAATARREVLLDMAVEYGGFDASVKGWLRDRADREATTPQPQEDEA